MLPPRGGFISQMLPPRGGFISQMLRDRGGFISQMLRDRGGFIKQRPLYAIHSKYFSHVRIHHLAMELSVVEISCQIIPSRVIFYWYVIPCVLPFSSVHLQSNSC